MLLKNVNIRIAISSKCNMNCLYCEGSDGFKPEKPGAMEDFRRKPLDEGEIDTKTLLHILKSFRTTGFEGLTLTGGEPLLRPDWDKLVKDAAGLGFKRIEITTNGMLLEAYINKHGQLPKELTKIKISLDTVDPDHFRKLTRGGDFNKIILALNKLDKQVPLRANKVLLKSELPYLPEYISECEKMGFSEISLLDLVYYSNRGNDEEKRFFQKEFVSFQEIEHFFKKKLQNSFTEGHKYGHALVLPSGMKIVMKDSDVAVRDKNCLKCPVYCQEGIYTVRIATDGNITYCPDYKGELPSIDGPAELASGTLDKKTAWLAQKISRAKKIDSFEEYAKKHAINFE